MSEKVTPQYTDSKCSYTVNDLKKHTGLLLASDSTGNLFY